jgi:hypothetical protein
MKSSTIVPISIALLQPNLIASKGIKVGARKSQRLSQKQTDQTSTAIEQQEERDLYTSETINIEQAECCTATVPAVVEIEYTDDGFIATNGTNSTVSPTEDLAPRPTPLPTEEIVTPVPTFTDGSDTPAPTPCDAQSFFFDGSTCSNEFYIADATAYTTLVACCDFHFGIGSLNDACCNYVDVCNTEPISTPSPTFQEDTPSPTPNPDDDGGLTDDYYIATPKPSRRPTQKPSGKPSRGVGYIPTSSNFPTYDEIDDWASGWMPTNPSKDDDDHKINDDVDDWHGGYPVHPTVDSKAGKSHKGGKSGKGSKSVAVTDDAYRGYGLSKVSSLVSSEVSSAPSDFSAVSVMSAVSALIVYLYL